jgi:hypothetical protein
MGSGAAVKDVEHAEDDPGDTEEGEQHEQRTHPDLEREESRGWTVRMKAWDSPGGKRRAAGQWRP